jgi:hypothetical protein
VIKLLWESGSRILFVLCIPLICVVVLLLVYGDGISGAMQGHWFLCLLAILVCVMLTLLHLNDMFSCIRRGPFDPRSDLYEYLATHFADIRLFVSPYFEDVTDGPNYIIVRGTILAPTTAKLGYCRKLLALKWLINASVILVLNSFIATTILAFDSTAFANIAWGDGYLKILYYTSVTLSTLGYGDVHPITWQGYMFVLYSGIITIGMIMLGAAITANAWFVLQQKLEEDVNRRLKGSVAKNTYNILANNNCPLVAETCPLISLKD